MNNYLCSLDVGTTGVKAAIISTNGLIKSVSYREYGVSYPSSGWVEQSVDVVWRSVCEVVREALTNSKIDATDIAALAISNQRATFLPLDKSGTPLTPYILWQDQRSTAQCEKIKKMISPREYHAISGLDIGTTASISKYLWLKEHFPDLFKNTAKFATMQDMLLQQFGVQDAPCDYSTGSWTGVFDINRLMWSEDLLNLFEIPIAKMPSLSPSCQTVGKVSAEASKLTGLLSGTPLVTGGGDGQCASLGCGVTHNGQVSIILGTAAVICSPVDHPFQHIDLNCCGHVIPGLWEVEGSALATGAAYRWWRDTFGVLEKTLANEMKIEAYSLFDKELETLEDKPSDILVIPTFMGGGTPGWYPHAKAALIGVTLSHSRYDIMHGLIQGIFLEIRGLTQELNKLGIEFDTIRVVGGMSKSNVLSQMLANILGSRIEIPSVPHAGLIGAAICAAMGCNLFSSVEIACNSLIQISEQYVPDGRYLKIYNNLFETYQKAYNLLCHNHIYEELARIPQ